MLVGERIEEIRFEGSVQAFDSSPAPNNEHTYIQKGYKGKKVKLVDASFMSGTMRDPARGELGRRASACAGTCPEGAAVTTLLVNRQLQVSVHRATR